MIKRFLFLACLMGLGCTTVYSQTTFEKTFSGTINYGLGAFVRQTSDSGFIVAGSTTEFGAGTYDAYFIKTDSLGDTLWTRTVGSTGEEAIYYIQQTSDGGYVGTGFSSSFGSADIYLVRLDAQGRLLWTRTYGGTNMDQSYCVEQTRDGGFIIEGFTMSFGAGQMDVYLLKTDSLGGLEWSKTYGGTDFDNRNSVRQMPDGGYILAGQTLSFGAGNGEIYLIKTDSAGNVKWNRTFGGFNGEFGAEIQLTTDGGFVIAGSTQSFGAGDYDMFLIKTDSLGDTLWAKTYGGTGFDGAYSVQLTSDGGFILSGQTMSFGNGDFDVYVVKTDSLGKELWSRSYGGTGNDQANTAHETFDGGYIISGITDTLGSPNYHMLLIKTDHLGHLICGETTDSTITLSPTMVVTNPPTLVSSPATVVTLRPATTSSGSVLSTRCQTSVAETGRGMLFFVAPNPSSGIFRVSMESLIHSGIIEVFNMLGERILLERLTNSTSAEINLHGVVPGIYFLKISEGNAQKSKRVVVE